MSLHDDGSVHDDVTANDDVPANDEHRDVDREQVLSFLRRRAELRPPTWPPAPLPGPRPRPRVSEDEALGFLHTHWVLPDKGAPARGHGWRRKLQERAGRIVFMTLKDYLAQERELLSHLVQVSETLARRVDDLEADIRGLAAVARSQLAELLAYVPHQAEHEADTARAATRGSSGKLGTPDGETVGAFEREEPQA